MMRSALALAPAVLFAIGCGSSNPKPEGRPPTGAGGFAGAAGSGGVGGTGGDAGSGGTAAEGAGGSAGEGTGGTAGEGGDGGASGGGSGGDGGSGGGKPLEGGEHGVFPKTLTEKHAQRAYQLWKKDYVESCGANGVRVIGHGPDETLSEGIGFGALLTVAYDDKETFDGIWKYYRKAADVSDALKNTQFGLMGWFVGSDACELGEVYSGSATGADLNMAMALFQAECQWGGGEYFAGATRLIDSIRTNATKRADGRTVLLPTDGIAQSDSPCSNPSYYSPAFYRVFAKAVPAEASFWNGFADDSYELLESASASATHLAPDWAANSSDVCPSEDGYVGYDGIRTIWRVATDYNWFGTEEAKAWLDDVNGYMTQNVGAARLLEVKDGFFADGAGMLTTPGTANSAFVGAFAVGTLAADQKTSDEFHEVFADIPRSNDTSYYAVTMRAVFMLLSAGRFSPGCY